MNNPNHIAIIMDGNGRWGQKKFKNRLTGHQYGVKNIKHIINYFLSNKIKNLTLYAFSNDNFLKRKKKEVNNIFYLLEKYLKENEIYFQSNKINLNFIGEIYALPKHIKNIITNSNKKFKFVKQNLNLNIAFNYSSKLEIISAIKKTDLHIKKININNIDKNLYTNLSNDPEIIIRTGGHKRLSDFLLWQSAYSEIYFVKTLWPDFKASHLKKIINDFKKIIRNYGS